MPRFLAQCAAVMAALTATGIALIAAGRRINSVHSRGK